MGSDPSRPRLSASLARCSRPQGAQRDRRARATGLACRRHRLSPEPVQGCDAAGPVRPPCRPSLESEGFTGFSWATPGSRASAPVHELATATPLTPSKVRPRLHAPIISRINSKGRDTSAAVPSSCGSIPARYACPRSAAAVAERIAEAMAGGARDRPKCCLSTARLVWLNRAALATETAYPSRSIENREPAVRVFMRCRCGRRRNWD
jgi:hypothetical protein